jgi:molybdopterin converting factor small subunit
LAQITFNAFSFLQKKLKQQNREYANVLLEVPVGSTVRDILKQVGLRTMDVEGVFVNGIIRSFEEVIKDGDRVAAVPPGTPGPYRVLLGIVKKK